ncbi:neuronal acetylcholine receptor subunit alpha-10-like [Cetorhinus maximus]
MKVDHSFGKEKQPGSLCAEGNFANQLLGDLFVNESSVLRPVLNTDQGLNVTLQITLFQVIHMDERNQILTTYLWIRQMWADAFRHWDKDEYGGLDVLLVPSSYVWRPDIVLYNSAEDQFTSPMETKVVVRHDGRVTWDSPAITRTSCKVDTSSFPFDGQWCPLTFGSWTYSGNEVNLLPALDGAELSDLVENVEWEVLGTVTERNIVLYGCCSEPYPDITFTLALHRRPAFHIYNLLLPCTMISSLVPLSFYLPADSNEKVSLGVTILLAFTVFQQMVAEIVPPSETLPLIRKYYIAPMMMMTASTALSMLIMNIHHCSPESKPVPSWARVVILHHMARILLVRGVSRNCAGSTEAVKSDGHPKAASGRWLREEEEDEEETSGQKEPEQLLSNTSANCDDAWEEVKVDRGQGSCRSHCPPHWERLVRNIEVIRNSLSHQRETRSWAAEWRKVARVLDRLYMWLFVLMVISLSVLVMVKAL